MTLRVVVIGTGTIMNEHLKSLYNAFAEVVAIADPNFELAQQKACEFQIPKVYPDYMKMIDSESIDAAVVAVPNFLHAPIVVDLLERGIHTLVEKPAALNSSEVKLMIEARDRSGAKLMISQNKRFLPGTEKLRELVRTGHLGTVYRIKAEWIRRQGIPGWGSWFTQKKFSGGGALIDIGVHVLDQIMYILQFPQADMVIARNYSIFGQEQRGLGMWGTPNRSGTFDVEDLSTLLVFFGNGTTLSLDVAWASYSHEEKNTVTLYGSRGGACLENSVRLYITKDDQEQTRHTHVEEFEVLNDRQALMHHFLDCIRKGTVPRCLPEESLAVQRILDGAYQSAESGQPIYLNSKNLIRR